MESPFSSEDTREEDTTSLQDIRKKLFSTEHVSSSKQAVEVYLRIRPKSEVEFMNEESSFLCQITDKVLITNALKFTSRPEERFIFSKIFGSSTTQKEIFNDGVVPLLEDFFDGQDCLLLAYGVTNSGKTYTITGTSLEPGILPRTLDVIFNSINGNFADVQIKPKGYSEISYQNDIEQEHDLLMKENLLKQIGLHVGCDSSVLMTQLCTSVQSNIDVSESGISGVSEDTCSFGGSVLGEIDVHEDYVVSIDAHNQKLSFLIFISYAEIYNEFIYDLLEDNPIPGKSRPVLKLSADKNGNPYVKGLREVKVKSAKEGLQLLRVGLSRRHVAGTSLNYHSSRSHAIFTIKIVKVLTGVRRPKFSRVNRLSIVDLAGSERSKKTGVKGERIKEAGSINTSLLTLGRCIEAMRYNQNAIKRKVVPFRDSKLTQLIHPYFVGKSNREGRIVMFVNVGDDASVFNETHHVLKFSALASKVIPVSKAPSFLEMNSCDSQTSSRDAECCPNCLHNMQQLELYYKKELAQLRLELWENECTVRTQVSQEYNKQIVEIEERYNREMEEQELLMEEELERRLMVTQKSLKKQLNARKRARTDMENGIHAEERNEVDFWKEQCFQKDQKLEELTEELRMEKNKAACEIKDLAETYENHIVKLHKQFNIWNVKCKKMTGELLPHSANLDSSQLLSNNSKDSKDVSVQTDVPTYSSCMMLDDKNIILDSLLSKELATVNKELLEGQNNELKKVKEQLVFDISNEQIPKRAFSSLKKEIEELQNESTLNVQLRKEKETVETPSKVDSSSVLDGLETEFMLECQLGECKKSHGNQVYGMTHDGTWSAESRLENNFAVRDLNLSIVPNRLPSVVDGNVEGNGHNLKFGESRDQLDFVIDKEQTSCKVSSLKSNIYNTETQSLNDKLSKMQLNKEKQENGKNRAEMQGECLERETMLEHLDSLEKDGPLVNKARGCDIGKVTVDLNLPTVSNFSSQTTNECICEELDETGRYLDVLDRSSQLIDDSCDDDFDVLKPVLKFDMLKDTKKKKAKAKTKKFKNEDGTTSMCRYNLRARKAKTNLLPEKDENLSPMMKIRSLMKVTPTGKKKRAILKNEISAPLDCVDTPLNKSSKKITQL